ncbi:MAG: MBL fold metallo-hydrolase RNA specificity domain-containing protein [Candidatus Micrarchaeia archaeon]|jgi:predicted metal-dependent RNase
MEISFLGGAREVGRSCIMVNGSILLDCGIKLGSDEKPLVENANSIKAIFLTHAHLDHSGYIPFLLQESKTKPKIYGLKPTSELSQILISDFIKLRKENKEGDSISSKSLNDFILNFKNVEFKNYKILGMDVGFFRAGHILGSSMIKIDNTLYTGDFNLRSSRLIDGAYTNIKAENLIIETTYADQNFPSQKEIVSNFIKSINSTLKENGKVLIPTFGVGRSQEILFILESYMRSGVLKEVPIYIEGMIAKANRIFRHNVIYCKEEIQKRILMSEDDPFKSKYFKRIKKKERKKALEEACIVVSTSGMLTGGPIIDYIRLLSKDESSKILIVGYQAQGTNGRNLIEGKNKIFDKKRNEEIEIKMKVEEHHLSSHADRRQIIEFIKKVKPKRVFFVHGEENKALQIAKYFEENEKEIEVYVPKIGEDFKV